MATLPKFLNNSLQEDDPEIYDLVQKEKKRQFSGLELIASENFTAQSVMEATGSAFTNKYSEGLPNARYYGGNEYVDQVELLAISRALKAFGLDAEEWGVNVQPYSGSTANFAALTALIKPNDRLMGLDLPSGGHLTHGYQTAKKKISSSSIYFASMPYQVNMQTGWIDYDRLEENAQLFRPQLLICGASAYPRDWEYERLRKIADINQSYLMADIAHTSGLIAAKELKSPFEFCDIVTTTTHKTLRGPRAGLIFFRKRGRDGQPTDLEARVNQAVFPSNQGGPHNNTIAGIAVALKQVATQEFKDYAAQVRKNAKALAAALQSFGYKLVTDGTDNHIVLWDLRPIGLTGSKYEKLAEKVHISTNKNAVHGDSSALNPGGVRVGTPAMTSRGLVEADFAKVAEFLHKTAQLGLKIQEKSGKQLKDFVAALENNADVEALAKEVFDYSRHFPIPGFTTSDL